MSKALNNQVAIVTGASRGIGRAIALRLASDGAAVAVNYSGSADAAEAVVQQITTSGGRALAVEADISQVAAIQSLFDQTLNQWGRLDILVNNAGALMNKPIAQVSEAEFDRLFAVNVKGTFFACQQAALRMNSGGRIINFSSSTTAMMLPTYGAYVATKGAVEQLTHILAKELGEKQIRVNCVSPGPTDTELFSRGKTPEQKAHFGKLAALGRLGLPEDIANVVSLLASPDAAWITGQNIRANGGTI